MIVFVGETRTAIGGKRSREPGSSNWECPLPMNRCSLDPFFRKRGGAKIDRGG